MKKGMEFNAEGLGKAYLEATFKDAGYHVLFMLVDDKKRHYLAERIGHARTLTTYRLKKINDFDYDVIDRTLDLTRKDGCEVIANSVFKGNGYIVTIDATLNKTVAVRRSDISDTTSYDKQVETIRNFISDERGWNMATVDKIFVEVDKAKRRNEFVKVLKNHLRPSEVKFLVNKYKKKLLFDKLIYESMEAKADK